MKHKQSFNWPDDSKTKDVFKGMEFCDLSAIVFFFFFVGGGRQPVEKP